MAANGTKVRAEALAAAIQNFESRKGEFQNAYLKISNIVRELSVNYKSEAATAFYQKFDDIYKNISQTEVQMENAINKLKQVKEIYDALFALQQALVNALKTDAAAGGNVFG